MTDSGPPGPTLVSRIRAGDLQAFEEAFRESYPRLLRFARANLRDEMAAEDVVQEVFMNVWRLRERIPADAVLQAYLLRAVRNRVINASRKTRRRSRWVEPLRQGHEYDPAAGIGAASAVAQPDPAELAELDDAIRRAVEELPERCRTAFLLCREGGLTYDEAAEVMGIAPGTVHTQMKRALAALRRAVEPFLTMVVLLDPLLK